MQQTTQQPGGVPVQVLDLVKAIRAHVRVHGFSPTTRELAATLGYQGRSALERWVRIARELGLVEHPTGARRVYVAVTPPGVCRACGHSLEGAN
jgi:hypothetical protein